VAVAVLVLPGRIPRHLLPVMAASAELQPSPARRCFTVLAAAAVHTLEHRPLAQAGLRVAAMARPPLLLLALLVLQTLVGVVVEARAMALRAVPVERVAAVSSSCDGTPRRQSPRSRLD
jgi:hypothetical protein